MKFYIMSSETELNVSRKINYTKFWVQKISVGPFLKIIWSLLFFFKEEGGNNKITETFLRPFFPYRKLSSNFFFHKTEGVF